MMNYLENLIEDGGEIKKIKKIIVIRLDYLGTDGYSTRQRAAGKIFYSVAWTQQPYDVHIRT